MPMLREELIVDRPLQEVWEFISDFANSEAWDPGVASARKVTEGDVRVGTCYALQVVFNGKEMPMTYEVTEYEPTRRVVLHGDGSPITAVDDIRFTATPDGGTKIDYVADLRLKGVLKIAAPLLRGKFAETGRAAIEGMRAALSA